jgi:hypothetical protein
MFLLILLFYVSTSSSWVVHSLVCELPDLTSHSPKVAHSERHWRNRFSYPYSSIKMGNDCGVAQAAPEVAKASQAIDVAIRKERERLAKAQEQKLLLLGPF